MLRDTRLEVDLDILAWNFRELRRALDRGPPARDGGPVRLAAVLKADAYGLGARAVSDVAVGEGADLLAVACLPEALELRRRHADAHILIMGHTPTEHLERTVREEIECTVFDLSQARELSRAASGMGTTAALHLKIDTGLNRLGLKPGPDTPGFLEDLALLPGLRLESAFTHLALRNVESDRAQIRLFEETLALAEAWGARFRLRHVCDSIGLVRYPEYRMDMVRAGALLYGMKSTGGSAEDMPDVRVPFAWRTRVSRLRPLAGGEGVGYDDSYRAPPRGALLATLPAGYADGYRRCLSNRAQVLIRGRRAPVVGLVNMDQCAVDVTGVPGVREGDEVLLLGTGREGEVPILEMAGWAGTNRNEILSSVGRRVPRVYLRDGAPAGEADYLEL